MDRDGTIIYDVGYPRWPEQVQFLPDVYTSLAFLQDQGYLLFLISNQSGIGRGLITHQEADSVHREVVSSLGLFGIYFCAIYYCIHAPEEMCRCRKPSPEMILNAAKEFDVDLSRSFMIGDRTSDIKAGKDAGCSTIYLLSDSKQEKCDLADYQAYNWQDICRYVIAKNEKYKCSRF